MDDRQQYTHTQKYLKLLHNIISGSVVFEMKVTPEKNNEINITFIVYQTFAVLVLLVIVVFLVFLEVQWIKNIVC